MFGLVEKKEKKKKTKKQVIFIFKGRGCIIFQFLNFLKILFIYFF